MSGGCDICGRTATWRAIYMLDKAEIRNEHLLCAKDAKSIGQGMVEGKPAYKMEILPEITSEKPRVAAAKRYPHKASAGE